MKSELVAHFYLAVEVFRIAGCVMWAKDSLVLTNLTHLKSKDWPDLDGFRVERDLDAEGYHHPDGVTMQFKAKPRIKPQNLSYAHAMMSHKAAFSSGISPHLVVVFASVVKRLSVGIILKRRTLLTTCTSTLVNIGDRLFSIKPEVMVIMSQVKSPLGGSGIHPVNLVAEIRRHPFCGLPFAEGPWMNDAAILILHAELKNPLVPIQLASEAFPLIFSYVQQRMSSGTLCQAIGIKSKNASISFRGASVTVRITNRSNCSRLCNYLIPQCEPQIGGYFVQYDNPSDKSQINDWLSEAALVCNDKLYGVVSVKEFACDSSMLGLMPKPEAVLHMHLSTAHLLASPPTTPPARQNSSPTLIDTLVSCWILFGTRGFQFIIQSWSNH